MKSTAKGITLFVISLFCWWQLYLGVSGFADPGLIAVYLTFALTSLHFAFVSLRLGHRIKGWLRMIDAIIIEVRPDRINARHLLSSKSCSSVRNNVHPRSLTGNFHELEGEFKAVITQLRSSRWSTVSICIKMFGLDDGGYTNIELRAFREAALGGGANHIVIAGDLAADRDITKVLLSAN